MLILLNVASELLPGLTCEGDRCASIRLRERVDGSFDLIVTRADEDERPQFERLLVEARGLIRKLAEGDLPTLTKQAAERWLDENPLNATTYVIALSQDPDERLLVEGPPMPPGGSGG